MFSIYGSSGRLFRGTLEQMRQIPTVQAVARSRAIEAPVGDGHDAAAREALEHGAPVTAFGSVVPHLDAQRSAIAAYAATQQPSGNLAWYDIAVQDAMTSAVFRVVVTLDGREVVSNLSPSMLATLDQLL